MKDVQIERVREKLAYIEEQTAALTGLVKQTTLSAFRRDPWKVRGARYALQTAIEAMIDTLYHLAAKGFSFCRRTLARRFTISSNRGCSRRKKRV